MNKQFGDVNLKLDSNVAIIEMQRPPHNFFDQQLLEDLATALEEMDGGDRCRAVLLTSQGRSFCAGADLPANSDTILPEGDHNPIYTAAVRLFATRKPIIAAIHGPAVGGGLGLSLIADFRFCSPAARFCANFAKLGFHPGFGLTHTLPALIGRQKAALMLLTGRRIAAQQALDWGLADALSPAESLYEDSLELAREIAANAPLTVASIRASLRQGLADQVQRATDAEFLEQSRQRRTADFREGIKAVSERRPGNFNGN